MGLLKKPMTIVDANVWVNGVSHLGTSISAKTPKIATGRAEQKTAGFSRKLSTGIFEPLESEFEIAEYSPAVMQILSQAEDGDYLEILLKGSIYSGGKKVPVVATWKGLVEVEDGDLKAGEQISQKVKIDNYYASLVVDGYEHYRLDIENLIGVVDGKDILEQLRKHIM